MSNRGRGKAKISGTTQKGKKRPGEHQARVEKKKREAEADFSFGI